MSSLKLALQVDAANPIPGDLFIDGNGQTQTNLSGQTLYCGQVRLTQTLSEEVAQLLFTRFRFFKGEWFLDRTAGIPYYQSILGIKAPLSIVTQIFRQVVTTCPGVASLVRFSVTRQPNRGLLVSFAAKLADGAILTEADFIPFVLGQ